MATNANVPWKFLGVGALLMVILIYFLGRQGGKKKTEKESLITAPVPNTDFIDPNLDIPGFAKTLYDSMKGLNYSDRGRVANFRKLYNLNNSEFISVYNEFNTKWGDGQTLRQWIKDEYIGVTTDLIKSSLEIRFESLNLS